MTPQPNLRYPGGAPGRSDDRKRKVALSQLALTCSIVLVVLLGWIQTPDGTFFNDLLLGGIAVHCALLLLVLLVPWHALPAGSVLAIPLADFITLGLLRAGAGEFLAGVGLLAVFPVAWIAAARVRTRTAVALALTGALGIVWAPLVAGGGEFSDYLKPLLLPVVLAGLAAFVSVLTTERRAQEEMLRASQSALQQSAEAQEHRERLLDAILETVDVGVLAVDRDGHDVLMNARQRAAHVLATPPTHNDPNESQLLLFGADRETPLAEHERPVRRAVRGESFAGVQLWAGSGRDQRALSVSARSMRDDDGGFAGTVVSFTDVTSLLEALAAKDDFLSNVSHEFRTPLTAVLGFLELILERREALPAEVVRYVGIARRNAMQLEGLVDDLLSISAGTFSVSPSPTDVGELICLCVASAQPRAANAGVHLASRAPETLEAVADPRRLGQALDNLLSNAIKYNRPGGTVTVSAGLRDDVLVVEVQDTGIGIQADELSQVFDRFFRSPAVRISTVQGVGLGLLITKSIVSEHGGTISVASDPGRGSTFTVSLPQGASPGAGNHEGGDDGAQLSRAQR